MSVWFITGASRGFGLLIAREKQVAADIEAWRALSVSTDHDDVRAV
ncbi:hypothetical protein AB0M44_17275 [Streptosporangium subroseum]